MLKREQIIDHLTATLDPERLDHSFRVEKVALALGKKHRVNAQQLSLAALLHDCARRYDRPQLLREARRLGIKITPISRIEPKLLHGEIGAILAREEFGVTSAGVLNAIRRHTTGAPGMSKLEKIIYLADHVEEGRDFPGVARLRRLAFENLDRAVAESTGVMLRFLLSTNLPVDPQSLVTRNYYLGRIR